MPSRRNNAILLVEDHPVFGFGLSQFLSLSLPSHRIVLAASKADALAALEREPFVLASFDLGLPDLAGPGELTSIRRRWPNMRLVVLSGREGRETILAALEAGVHGYLLKSTPMEALLERLERVLNGEIYVPPAIADLPPEERQDATSSQPLDRLTDRQREMLTGLVGGKTNKEMANELGIAESTVKLHLASLFRAIGASNRTQAASVGRQILNRRVG